MGKRKKKEENDREKKEQAGKQTNKKLNELKVGNLLESMQSKKKFKEIFEKSSLPRRGTEQSTSRKQVQDIDRFKNLNNRKLG